jgi:hypothetical protein
MSENRFINIKIAEQKTLLWVLAVVITISSAVYQRLTGPTFPIRGKVTIAEQEISFRLLRSETTDKDVLISLEVPDTAVSGHIIYKRFRSYDELSKVPLQREGNILQGTLPKQPAAGKLLYYVYLTDSEETISLTGKDPVILRYKGSVPATVLIPHVLLMFMAMLISNRAGLESLDRTGNARKYLKWVIGLFFVGGFILGPVVQKFAFGEYWTGIPFGYDLTDNKTLLGMMGWLFAWYRNRKDNRSRGSILFASLLLLAMYLIPHSMFGSELDYTQIEAK